MEKESLTELINKSERTREALAEMLSIDRATLYRKMKDPQKFTVGEARKLKEQLNLTQAQASYVFFGD
ncbi:MAG: XRE family transcriptional regulator [Ruminococcaceae bacterium]|nr:XRE family transcriptional regulator [Oscillospiraceae bacterium]